MFDENTLLINPDIDTYKVPTKEELLYTLELYFSLLKTTNLSSISTFNEEYNYLIGLINLEYSIFDLKFKNIPYFSSKIYYDISRYNVWYRTKNLIEGLNDSRVTFSKEDGKCAIVKVIDTPVCEYRFDSLFLFKPTITIHCYENKDEYSLFRILQLKKIYLKLKCELIKCQLLENITLLNNNSFDKIDNILVKHIELDEHLKKVRDILNKYKENLHRYNQPLYKEVAYLLLDEYCMPNEKGKTLAKTEHIINVERKSY